MKKYILTLISLAIATACGVMYQIIGSEVAPDGTLIEPFYLIPIGYLFLATSLISALIVTFSIFKVKLQIQR
ncbi:MAG: DUF3955 domain-containing protein [Acidaminobacteraceae bacterium]